MIDATSPYGRGVRIASWSRLVRRLSANRLGFVGGLIVLAAIAVAILAPWIAPFDPNEQNTANRFAPPFSPGSLLGTDEFGRDVLSRVMYSARVSLLIAGLAVTVAGLLGGTIGLAVGYLGGWVDVLVMRVVDALSAIPGLMIGLGVLGLLGPRIEAVVVALGIAYSAPFARISRFAAVTVRSQPYIEASRVLGSSTPRILREDVLPNVLPLLMVQVTAMLASAILDEAAFGFLGLSVQPPTASWGSMLTTGRTYFFHSPTVPLVAGFAVMLVVFGFNLLGDALRDVLDPRSWRGRE